MKRLVYLPLDDRPVNYDDPRTLAEAAGWQMDLPPREWLGTPWRASRHADLVDWLRQAAAGADALLVAVDTLAYGGLIPSRTSLEPFNAVLARLSILREIKTAQPKLDILAYSVILRISRADSAEEEKEYWADYGSRMFRLSFLEHKSSLGQANSAEDAERSRLRASIPDAVYSDYLRGRARNHAVNCAMLDWLGEGVFDYLLFPQDDTADYGWNIAETRTLQGLIRARGLSERAITYPGADEIASLLLAALVCRRSGFAPRVWVRYSSVAGPHSVTAYEDRPVHELLKAHLAPLGGCLVDTIQEADLGLFLNAPAVEQGDAALQGIVERQQLDPALHPQINAAALAITRAEMTTPHRSPEEFVRALRIAIKGDALPVALADLAFVNGADLALGKLLAAHDLFPRLAAYGGWNTAGNTLGSVLAQAVIHALAQRQPPAREQQAAHLTLLFRRCLDDFYYQAVERTNLLYEDLPALGLAPSFERLPTADRAAVEELVCRRLLSAAEALKTQFIQAGLARDVQVSNIYLPWQRLFEVGFEVRVVLP